jgi:predicted DNA-binding protein
MNWKTGQSRYQLWLPDTLRQRLEQAAKADKRKVSDYIRIAIEAACTKAEEQAHNKPFEDGKNA